jgi:transcriptional regulator NrdR family protein
MKCPFCNSSKVKVVATSPPWNNNHNSYKRYRKCTSCGASFTTIESYAEDYNKPRAYIRGGQHGCLGNV